MKCRNKYPRCTNRQVLQGQMPQQRTAMREIDYEALYQTRYDSEGRDENLSFFEMDVGYQHQRNENVGRVRTSEN
jgi:hypothetical protein